jgi:hypothetical protein
MRNRFIIIALFFAAGLSVTAPALVWAQSDYGPYDIMRPEPTRPGVIPPYRSPRGTRQHVTHPRPPKPEARHIPEMPPPLVSPRTGMVMPNIPPPVPGSGPGGAESFQDRASRCVHQSGVYNQAPGAEQNTYIGACINQ